MSEARDTKFGAIVFLAVGAAFAIPPLVFLIVGLSEGMGGSGSLDALIAQYSSKKQNLAILGLVGTIPIALLALVVWLVGKIKRVTSGGRRLAIGGAIAILAVLTWAHFEYWPTFLPQRTYAGFPHGLEFVIGPLVFAPIAMIVGIVMAAYWPARR